ncbi:MAG: GNAT family N-acetyltransferase [Alphaproteobacteria bacterium]|nr:GNAT family N-acetyltransferase [Alphaproteobacteria bacterium]
MTKGPRLLLAPDTPGAAALLARAFAADPVIRWLLAVDDAEYERSGPVFFTPMVARSHRRGHAYVLENVEGPPRRPVGIALWGPPDVPISTPEEGVAFRDALLDAAGASAFERIGALVEAMSTAHPPQPYFYLSTVGVDAADQGRGLGQTLLAPVLDRCDHDGLGAYLESSNPRNVAFYERLGFETVFHAPIDDGVALEGMWRAPKRVHP